jgi:hypothetical protein
MSEVDIEDCLQEDQTWADDVAASINEKLEGTGEVPVTLANVQLFKVERASWQHAAAIAELQRHVLELGSTLNQVNATLQLLVKSSEPPQLPRQDKPIPSSLKPKGLCLSLPFVPSSPPPTKSAAFGELDNFWTTEIGVCFFNGTEEQIQWAWEGFMAWKAVIPFPIKRVTRGAHTPETIRVSFAPDDGSCDGTCGSTCNGSCAYGSWSVQGPRGVKKEPFERPTLRLEFSPLRPDLPVHEFGHALGLGHEHQHPNRWWRWLEAKVFEDCGRFGWDEKMVREQILNPTPRLGRRMVESLDLHSVMMYPILRGWTDPALEFPQNLTLSVGDIAFFSDLYSRLPRPQSMATSVEVPDLPSSTPQASTMAPNAVLPAEPSQPITPVAKPEPDPKQPAEPAAKPATQPAAKPATQPAAKPAAHAPRVRTGNKCCVCYRYIYSDDAIIYCSNHRCWKHAH